jgi:hypothetical protein
MKSFVIVALLGLTILSVASAQFLTQDEAEELLSAEGITWSSSGRCTDRNNRRCTSFDNIRQNTINGIISFARGSGCDIVITGGSETGHSGGPNSYSHWNGFKVDIKITPCVDAYITGNFASIGRRSDGAAQYRSAAGNIYAREGNHWDILYY